MSETLPDISLAEPTSADIPLWQLRDNLIDATIALADELVAGADRDRLEALRQLYGTTLAMLRQRDLRVAR